MAKQKKGKKVQMLSPENYIRQRARTLPIHECWVNIGWKEDGMASVIVSRKHINGNFTTGMYLVDINCLGIKDANYYFNMSSFDYQDLINQVKQHMEIEQTDYTLAHNIVFAGLEFAEEFGFKPHKDFEISKYILEEDNDEIELLEIDCGENGKPIYIRGPHDNEAFARKVIAQLENTAGPDNFFVDDAFDIFDTDEDYPDFNDEDFDPDFYDYNEKDKENSKTFQLKIQLKNVNNPSVWRRITVPSYFWFSHLHELIQAVFEWDDYHMYSFSPGGFGTSPSIEDEYLDDDNFADDSEDKLPASETKLSDIFNHEGQQYTYIYDFGDNWEHLITLEKILPESTNSPTCNDGGGKCPPEDCGGAPGYKNLKQIMADKKHPEYQEIAEWLSLDDGESWNPNEFDLEEMQNYFRDILSEE